MKETWAKTELMVCASVTRAGTEGGGEGGGGYAWSEVGS